MISESSQHVLFRRPRMLTFKLHINVALCVIIV